MDGVTFINLRARIIHHILFMKTLDPDYARDALKRYDALLPDFDLMDGVRQALKAQA